MAHNDWNNKKLDDLSVKNKKNETGNKIKDDINSF